MFKKRVECLICTVVSLLCFETGLLFALYWYWSGFRWSPFGYENCGLEFAAMLMISYPAFAAGLLIRGLWLCRWKYPYYGWFLPLILCGVVSCAWAKSLDMGILCIVSMIVLPVADFSASKKLFASEYWPLNQDFAEKWSSYLMSFLPWISGNLPSIR